MHSRNTVRYYLIVAGLLLFLFFSNDFGLIDIQKTALVMAVGIDREKNTFIVTTQIAIPEPSSQGQAQAVQIESRGETVADAYNQINVKTGWYPKLVFCDLIVLGEDAVKSNVFDTLDFFLRDEYMSDGCLVATCEGTAKELLNTTTPIDPMSSLAAQKVLSEHAEQVGTVASNTLLDFSIGYFGNSRSSYLPILKPEKQQESSGENSGENKQGGKEESGGGNGGAFGGDLAPVPGVPVAGGGSGGGGEEAGVSGGEAKKPEEKVFSASETALFYNGVMVGKLDADETFAFCMVKNKLRLASYPLQSEGGSYTLRIKKNKPSLKFSVDKNSMAKLKIHVKATAGIQDAAFSQTVTELSNAGAVPPEVFKSAEKKLKDTIVKVFDKSRKSRCDVFNVLDQLQKFENNYFSAFREDILDRLILEVSVDFESLR